MAFLDYNLANLRGIGEKTGQISSQAFQGEQAAKGRFSQTMQNFINTLNRRREQEQERGFVAGEAKLGREFRAGEARLGREFTAGEAGLGREFSAEEARKKAEALKASEDKMYQQYENGSYKDDLTGIDYTWSNRPEFEMQLAKMKADRDRHLAKLSAGEGKDTDIYGAFTETLINLGPVFSDGGLDLGTLRYDTAWMLENKDDFKSAFNELIGSKYNKEQQASLNNLLDRYLAGYKLEGEPEAEPEAAEGEGIFAEILAFLKGQKETTEGYERTFGEPAEMFPNLETTEGFQRTFGKTEASIKEDFFDTLNQIHTAEAPVHLKGDPRWSELINSFINLPNDLPSDQMQKLDRMMENAEEGKINRNQLDEFIAFVKSFSSTPSGSQPGIGIYGGM